MLKLVSGALREASVLRLGRRLLASTPSVLTAQAEKNETPPVIPTDNTFKVDPAKTTGFTYSVSESLSSRLTDDAAVVRLRGLPYSCTKQDIINFLDGCDVTADRVNIVPDKKGRGSSEAFVHFVNKQDQARAVEKDRKCIGHRYIEVFVVSVQEVKAQEAKLAWRVTRNGAVGGGAEPPPPPREVQTASHVVYMRGMPYTATKQDIEEFFKPLTPVNIDILISSNNGRPSGDAVVQFQNDEDVEQAMKLHKKHMEHRYIELFQKKATHSYQR